MKNVIPFPDRSIIEDEASRWIVRFEGDEPPTQQDVRELEAWTAQSREHRDVLIQLASNWNNMDLLSRLVVPLDQTQKQKKTKFESLAFWCLAPARLLMRILAGLGQRIYSSPRIAVALSVALILGVVVSYRLVLYPAAPPGNTYLTVLGEQSNHVLADGSTLSLNTDSRVEVIYSGQKRQILLHQGEAHFNVAQDPSRPFEVYAGTRMVRAVGTAFTVFRDQDQLRVTVTEGKVDLATISASLVNENIANANIHQGESISPKTQVLSESQTSKAPQSLKTKEITEMMVAQVIGSLRAGQSVVIPANSSDAGVEGAMDEIVNHEQMELARRLSWMEGQLVFAGESLEEVVREVSRYTPLTIEVATPELKKMRIGGQFQIGKTEELFDVLESSFGLEISRLSEQHVRIHSKE